MGDGSQKGSRILLKIFRMKFRSYKCAEIWKFCEKLFLSENNPTSTFKKMGFFGRKNGSPISLKILSDEAQMI